MDSQGVRAPFPSGVFTCSQCGAPDWRANELTFFRNGRAFCYQCGAWEAASDADSFEIPGFDPASPVKCPAAMRSIPESVVARLCDGDSGAGLDFRAEYRAARVAGHSVEGARCVARRAVSGGMKFAKRVYAIGVISRGSPLSASDFDTTILF